MAWRRDLACLVGGTEGGTRGWNAARCFRQAACVLTFRKTGFSYSCFPDGEVVVWEGDVSKAKAPHCVGWVGMQSEGWELRLHWRGTG